MMAPWIFSMMSGRALGGPAGLARAASRVATMSSSSTPQMDPSRWAARLVDEPPAGPGGDAEPVELVAVGRKQWKGWLAAQPAETRSWLEALGRSTCKPGELTPMPAAEPGALRQIVCPIENASSIWSLAALPGVLPAGRAYRLTLVGGGGAEDSTAAALSWVFGCYEYNFLKSAKSAQAAAGSQKGAPATLLWPDGCDRERVANAASATYLCRDLITTPCEQLGPADLERAARELAARHAGARVTAVTGEALLSENFPMIHAVGRAAGAGREPRLIELRWGREGAPKVALVGKGVMFDTGGLNLKPSGAMLTMKKDMVRAAAAAGASPAAAAQRSAPTLARPLLTPHTIAARRAARRTRSASPPW